MGALTGWYVGETAGHSLSPEGLKAQQLFAQNLYAGTVQRPISSLGTMLSVIGLAAE